MGANETLSRPIEQPLTLEEQGFDYDTIGCEIRIVVQQCTNEIKSLMRRTAQDIIDIGQKLISVKEQLGHGQFRNWLKAEFDWSVTTAARFMRVATRFKCANLANLDIAVSALYLLAEPSTPDEAQEEVLELTKQGETITHAQAKNIVNKHKEAAMLMASKPDSAIIPAETMGWEVSPAAIQLPVAQTVEAQSTAVVKPSEDKLPGKTTQTPEHLQMSNHPLDMTPAANSDDYFLKDQSEIDIQSLSLIGNLIYLTDQEQQESKLLGEVAEVKEATATDVIIRISLQPNVADLRVLLN